MADSDSDGVIRLEVGDSAKMWRRTVLSVGAVHRTVMAEVTITVLSIVGDEVTLAVHQEAREE